MLQSSGPTIEITGIECVGYHGVHEEERCREQQFRIDVQMQGDVERALTSDTLEDTIDYSRVVRVVRDVNQARNHCLVESLAEDMADALLVRFPKLVRVVLNVAKIAPPGLGRVASAAVRVTKTRQ